MDTYTSLNAPYGARCFLTDDQDYSKIDATWGLNAPYGARCFLTIDWFKTYLLPVVLMHLMALGAF